MTIGELYTYVNAMIAKEVEGNTFTPATFNVIINETNIQMFKDEYGLLERQAKATGKGLYELLFSGSPLRVFTETKAGSGSNIILLSTIDPAYEQFVACTAIHDDLYKDVELVDLAEANYRRAKMDGMLLYEQPIISLHSNKLVILPTDVGLAGTELIYLRMPKTPIYDYYIKNSTGKVYYLPPLYKAITTDGITKIYTSTGALVDSGVTVPGAIIGTFVMIDYTSRSVELEWKTSYHTDFVRRLLVKAGVPLRDAFIAGSTKTE